MQWLIGFLLAVIISFGAYRLHSLNKDGAFAAVFLGTIIFGFGGWQGAILLLTFFVSSSVLTRAFKDRKQESAEKYSKSGERDAGQVLGNGGLAAAFVVLHAILPQAVWPQLGFAAALAAVNADTWATELGALNPTPPRMITNLRKRVEKGTSGGLSLFGTLAALLGSAVIALLAMLIFPAGRWLFFLLIAAGGLLGSLFDSLLGATVQAMYFCPTENKETEKYPVHTCGTPTVHIRGCKWLNNDWVNVACGASGALTTLFLALVLH